MTLLLDTSLWIDFTWARSPAALKQRIAPYVLDPAALAAHASGSAGGCHSPASQPPKPPCLMQPRRRRYRILSEDFGLVRDRHQF